MTDKDCSVRADGNYCTCDYRYDQVSLRSYRSVGKTGELGLAGVVRIDKRIDRQAGEH